MWNSIAIFAAAQSVSISAYGEVELPHSSLIQLGLRGNTDEPNSLMMTSTAADTLKKGAVLKKTKAIDGSFVRSQYENIFPHGNRNAAAHRWFNYLYNQAKEGTAFDPDFAELNKYYCPISGSPTDGSNLAQIELSKVGGGKEEGSFSFCCSPCYCDMVDLVKVDTISVEGMEYKALVIGDPCTNSAIINDDGTLDVEFPDPYDSSKTENLGTSDGEAGAAPDVICESHHGGYKLQNATLSKHKHIVIGLLHDTPGITFSSDEIDCTKREEEGFVGGMGSIFRELAKLNPI
jgi:hypothetical protein